MASSPPATDASGAGASRLRLHRRLPAAQPPQPADLRRRVAHLVGCQWATAGVLVGLAAGAGATWGAWLPGVALILGAAFYVWALSPDKALVDRDERRRLALQSGVATGGMLAVAWVVALLTGTIAGAEEASAWRRVAATVVVLGAAVPTATLLTLVGLDGGRSSAVAEQERAARWAQGGPGGRSSR
jgi:hypothetical protein